MKEGEFWLFSPQRWYLKIDLDVKFLGGHHLYMYFCVCVCPSVRPSHLSDSQILTFRPPHPFLVYYIINYYNDTHMYIYIYIVCPLIYYILIFRPPPHPFNLFYLLLYLIYSFSVPPSYTHCLNAMYSFSIPPPPLQFIHLCRQCIYFIGGHSHNSSWFQLIIIPSPPPLYNVILL